MNKKKPKYEKIEVEIDIPQLKNLIKNIAKDYRPESYSIIEDACVEGNESETCMMLSLARATLNEYVCHALETELTKIKAGTSDFHQWTKTNKKTSKKKASK